MGVPQADHAVRRRLHIARVGNPPFHRRVSFATAFAGVPSPAFAPPTTFAACDLDVGRVAFDIVFLCLCRCRCIHTSPSGHVFLLVLLVRICVRCQRTYPCAPTFGAGAIVCLARHGPSSPPGVGRPHALSPNQQGDGTVAPDVRGRCQVRKRQERLGRALPLIARIEDPAVQSDYIGDLRYPALKT